jgi:hypothetical protein
MAYKFEIQNGAVKVTDTISSEVLIFQPARDTWFIEENLDSNLVKLYGTTGTNEDNINRYNRSDNSFNGFPLAECVNSLDVVFTQDTFRAFCAENLAFNSAEQTALKKQGFIDYNDTTGSISLTSDTWTDVPNNGAGAFTNKTYKPTDITELIDVNTGYLDFSELTLGSQILVRNDFTVVPNTNNALLEVRYVLGQGAGEYALKFWSERLDSGSGIDYQRVISFPIYMGDTNTQGGVGKLQVKLSTNGTLTNAGSYIKIDLK